MISNVQMYYDDIGSLHASVASDLDVGGAQWIILTIKIEMFQPCSGAKMTGCLADLMEKANEMGLDECWDDVSDDDKAILEPMFRLKRYNFCPT